MFSVTVFFPASTWARMPRFLILLLILSGGDQETAFHPISMLVYPST